MSSPVRTLLNIFLIVALIGGVYYLSQNIDQLRIKAAQMLHVSPKVLGVTTRINPADEIKKDVTEQVDVVKKQVLNIRVSDVLTTVGRAQKIAHDIQDLRTFTFTQLDELRKKK
jgi:hypothetical protein